MATSQNGWSASPDLDIRPLVVAGESFSPGIRDHKDVFTVLQYVAEQMHARVEPIVREDWHQADDWGFFYRANANDPNSLSNHSSGTAFDYNATRHPNGVPTKNTFTAKQIGEVHKILNEVDHVVRWGGDYTRTQDAMHFEINAGPSEVGRVASGLRNKVRTYTLATANLNFGRAKDKQQDTVDAIEADILFTQEDVRNAHRERVIVRNGKLRTLRRGFRVASPPLGFRIRTRHFAWKDIAVPGIGLVRFISVHFPPRRFSPLWPIYTMRLHRMLRKKRFIVAGDWNKRLRLDPANLGECFQAEWRGQRIDSFAIHPELVKYVKGKARAVDQPGRKDGHPVVYLTLEA